MPDFPPYWIKIGLLHYGYLESYFKVMSLDMMEGFGWI